MRLACHSLSDGHALVVSPLPFTLGGKRYRHNDINVVEESIGNEFLSEDAPQGITDVGAVEVFEFVDGLCRGRTGIVEKPSRGFLYRSKCDIYECSNGGVSMSDTTGITIEKCTFRDLGGNNLMLYGCSDVTVDGEPINGQNYNGR